MADVWVNPIPYIGLDDLNLDRTGEFARVTGVHNDGPYGGIYVTFPNGETVKAYDRPIEDLPQFYCPECDHE